MYVFMNVCIYVFMYQLGIILRYYVVQKIQNYDRAILPDAIDLTCSFCALLDIILKETGGEYCLEQVAREHNIIL